MMGFQMIEVLAMSAGIADMEV